MQYRERPLIAERRHQPHHDQDKVIVVLHVQERAQLVDRTATLGHWQWQHSVGAAQWRTICGRADAPPITIDLDYFPLVVAQVEVQASVTRAHSGEGSFFRAFEERISRQRGDGRADRIGAAYCLRRDIEGMRQPSAESPRLKSV